MLAPPFQLEPAERYADITAPRPDPEALRTEYREISNVLASAKTVSVALAAFGRWEGLRRSFETWANLTELHLKQSTQDPDRQAAADLLSEIEPSITGLNVEMKRQFLASPLRAQLEGELGGHVFAIWETEVGAFDPVIAPLAIRESKLQNDYTTLLAGARLEFRGEQLNLPAIAKYAEHPDRELRRQTTFAKWDAFTRRRGELDRGFDDLVRLRDRMARELGCRDFVELGYKRLKRTSYDRADVARYRETIVRDVLPIARRIVDAQARAIGVDELMLWDERIFGAAPPPKPPQAYGEMIGAAERAFDGLGPEIGSFARMMVERDLLDLRSREGKAGGGFCMPFPTHGLPYIFANFNGGTNDVNVIVHEMGHAFQSFSSRSKRVSEYRTPTLDACEVHSMAMEFLMWPQLHEFFGPDAQRYRLQHLKSSLLLLTYGAAVDHFQHFVYENPSATPQERNDCWKRLEETYLPWRRYGGIEHLENGGFWQAQHHVYVFPFYYIDYTLAMCCALQFWSRSLDDPARAWTDYVALCRRGGELAFQPLVETAGLRSPFDDGVLRDVVDRAARFIDA